MTDLEYNRRQRAAMLKLRKVGLHRAAQKWIAKHRPPATWRGTPLEYALEEMPRWWLLRAIGF